MTQITLKIDDSIVETLGRQQIETKIVEWLKELKRKIDLQEAVKELDSLQLSNHSNWQVTRNLAWEIYKHNFEVKEQ
jgi:signal recognition particle GTPase